MRGRDENGLKEAKTLFEEAVSLDPDYARAYVGLADAYFLLGEYYYLPTREANATSKETLRKALRLDDDLPEARTSLANLLQHEYRFSEAVAEYKRALALNPSYSQCHHWYSNASGTWEGLRTPAGRCGRRRSSTPCRRS